ncbi:unnamed protein product [Ilex paraguariensis]|uniref:MATH domain-containing protein n=1 Tax=Ilex paraguariensis TaxID=185542 RepID=A0ABC8R554_9AQUA
MNLVTLYLVATHGANTLPLGWEVNVNFKLFVYDQVRDKYLTIQDANGRVSRFNKLKTEWGFAKLLSLDTFNDASNGYLVDDSCAFGVEVYVIKSTGRGECLSVKMVEPSNNTYTWEIKNFSKLDDGVLYSELFSIGNHKWKIIVYPKGTGSAKGKSLSVFLQLADSGTPPTKRKLSVGFTLGVKSSKVKDHCWFSAPSDNWGSSNLVSLVDLHDRSKGFIVHDTLVVEVQIDVMIDVKEFT